VQTHTLLY